MPESSPGDALPYESRSPRWLLWLAGGLVAIPVFAFGWWREGSEIVLVLYRQPKALAISLLGWLLLTALLASRIRSPRWASLAAPTRLVEVRLLAAFLAWMALTLLWVVVPANSLVELQQYLLAMLLLVALVGWQWEEPGVARLLRTTLLTSLAVATLVGGLQLVVELPWLRPINPEIGAPNPSFLGYKNPMALAVLGQLFLLAEVALTSRGRIAWLWRGVLVAELAYLATLGSRTALAATAVAIFWLAGWTAARALHQRDGVSSRRGVAWGLLAVALFALAVVSHPVGRAKAASVLGFVASPASYLESDRGIYLRNTLEMVRHHPLGVGLGDWQTHYPVYRRHGRDVAFTATHQVRRAHSDPVQFLGEGGWPGLALWLVFLATTIGRQVRWFWKTGSTSSLFFSTQLVAFAAAMSTDYLIEMPFGKFQFFLVLALGLGVSPLGKGIRTPAQDDAGRPADRRILKLATLVMALALVANGFRQVQTLRRTVAGAALQQGYQAWASERPGGGELLLRRLEEHGETFLTTPGTTKTTHRDYLVLAHAQALLGRRESAITLAERCLDLHPYYPPAYELMSHLAGDPETARAWREAHHHLIEETTRGFELPAPPRLSR